ncbi:hypothetical protein JNL27_05030 [bacterium]|nr:hypothetical protein [bacterium]
MFSSKVVFPQFSPGDLSKAHAHLEGLDNCTQCHDLGKKINGGKCLQCHVLIKTRIDHNIGFHSSSQVRNKECIQCHTEHRGYGFDMIKWESGRSGFDHVQTGYLLEGKHKTAKCESCHKPEHIKDAAVRSRTNDDQYLSKTFLGLTQQCSNCHFDEHRNHLSQLCIKCHDFENWKTSAEQKFDHSATRFPLTGKHSLAACLQCHPLTLDSKQKPGGGVDLDYLKFTNIKFDKCTACHTDPHNNAFGQKCEKCHVPGGWQNVIISGFDHSKTNFPLTGKHLVVNCEKCHQPDIRKKAAYKNIKHDECRDCHTDIHAGQFAERADKGKCESCHNTKGFIPSQYSITRHNQIKFQLTGAHAAVTCIQCHVTLSPSEFILKIGTSIKPADSTTVFRFASLACASCHADIHKEQFKEKIDRTGCESCHKADSWSALIFDHNKDSKFPLNNKHAGIACSKCHLPDPEYAPYLKYKGTSSLCESCHFDVHFGQFAQYQELGSDHPITLCDRCHSDAGFKHLNFDHSAKSRFTLTGAHEKVACSKCHRAVTLNNGMTTIVYKPIEIKCSSCHANLE